MVKKKNYISQAGFDLLQSEYDKLFKHERPEICKTVAWAAGNGDRSENADYIYGKKRLREIDRRLRFLGKRLANAEVVHFLENQDGVIRFGATVELESEEEVKTIVICGVDEIDGKLGKISLFSPLGKSLMGKEEGDEVVVQTPRGQCQYTVINVAYIPWPESEA